MALTQSVGGEVTIGRRLTEVYEFYRDFQNLPRYLGDVRAVRDLGGDRYVWTVDGPMGVRLPMHVTVVQAEPDRRLRYKTSTPGQLAATWDVTFTGTAPSKTEVAEVLTGPLGAPVGWLMALIGKHPHDEVTANLQRLKELLEDGRVRTTRNATRGKFG